MKASIAWSLGVVVIGCAIRYLLVQHADWVDAVTVKLWKPTQRELEIDPSTAMDLEDCFGRFLKYLDAEEDDPFENVSVVLHRNGEADPCFATKPTTSILHEIKSTLATMEYCPVQYDDKKYQVESFLSRTMHRLTGNSCSSTESDRSASEGLLGYCDMGERKTPILLDHEQLIPIQLEHGGSRHLPCHFHTRNGVRINSLRALGSHLCNDTSNSCDDVIGTPQICRSQGDLREVHLVAVPAGRMFMFAPTHVNETIQLPHVNGADPSQPVYLQVLSLVPRVFELFNFFSTEESADLVQRALAETRDSHRIQRSSTGALGYAINSHRTSESGYDTNGKTAVAIKRRCFDVLGFDQYMEEHADGLQMLRYNTSTSYRSHLDYMDGSDTLEHDFDSALKGGNRFATILLYMTDMDEGAGGETVFPNAWPSDLREEERVSHKQALGDFRQSSDAAMFERDSWQEDMVAKCRSQLAVKSRIGRSILFYSQLPNGQVDPASLHGGCPVLKGTKYAANLWVWNTPRQGYQGNPKNPKYKSSSTLQ